MRYVALLRAINLGRVRQVKMADLRELYAGLGLTDVASYLQSGNVVFSTPDDDGLTERLEVAMAERYGFEIPTILVESEQFRAIADGCPYLEAATADPTTVHALFVDPTPSVLDFDPEEFLPEECLLADGVIYMRLPNQLSGSKLHPRVLRQVSDVKWTARNWRTVANLVEML